jgi:hypothetical protein
MAARRVAALIALTCLVAVVASLSRLAAQDVEPTYTGALRALVYSDRVIRDSERAQLVQVVADLVPRQYWREVDVAKDTTLDRLVDCYYDAFLKDDRTRLTAVALQNEIRTRNLVEWPLTNDVTLAMPPFPAIANRKQDPNLRRFRVYDAANDAYSITELLSAFSSKMLTRVGSQPKITNTSDCRVRLQKREAKLTAVLVPIDASREEMLSRLPRSVQQLSVGPDAQLGRVRVELLQDGIANCLENVDYLKSSPFWSELKRLVGDLGARLAKAASDLPLVIVDQNFKENTEEEGHGFRVWNVATAVLKELGLPEAIEADLIKKVEHVELCPTTKKDIDDLQKRVQEIPVTSTVPGLEPALKQQAEAWFAHLGEPCFSSEFDVPDLVLAAVLKRELATKPWLVMSFRARGSVQTVLSGVFDLPGVSIVAAGNLQKSLDATWIPQLQASLTQRVILVTYGGEKGVLGTSSNPGHEGLKVDTIAPGCGVGERWGEGSSFAAPVVAVGVWLKELVKRASGVTGGDGRNLRSEVSAASRPSVAIGRQVQATGVFDLSRYVVAPLRHIRFRDDVPGREGLPLVVPVIRGQLVIDCAGSNKIDVVGHHNSNILYTLTPSADRTAVLTRQLGFGSRLLEFAECKRGSMGELSLELTYEDKNMKPERFDWKKFTEQVVEVSF